MDQNRGTVPAVWASWINVLLGVWLIISPWVVGFARFSPAALWNSLILGIIIAIVAYAATQTTSPTPSWWNLVFGIWLIISPFILGFGSGSGMVNDVVLGIVVGILALVAALSKSQARPRMAMPHAGT